MVAAQMMRQMVSLVFSCTDREALNLAIFLNETFILLERWRVSPCPCAARKTFMPPSKAAFIHPSLKVSCGQGLLSCSGLPYGQTGKWLHCRSRQVCMQLMLVGIIAADTVSTFAGPTQATTHAFRW